MHAETQQDPFKRYYPVRKTRRERLEYFIQRDRQIIIPTAYKVDRKNRRIIYYINPRIREQVSHNIYQSEFSEFLQIKKGKFVGKDTDYVFEDFARGRIGEMILFFRLTQFLNEFSESSNSEVFNYRIMKGAYREVISQDAEFLLCYGPFNNVLIYDMSELERKIRNEHRDKLHNMERLEKFYFGVLPKDREETEDKLLVEHEDAQDETNNKPFARGEIDLLIEYSYQNSSDNIHKGLLICESKTARPSTRRFPLSPENDFKKNTFQKLVEPVRLLFPEHKITYLLMCPKEFVFAGRKGKLQNVIVDIKKFFDNRGVDTIFVPFNESQYDFSNMATYLMAGLHMQLVQPGVAIDTNRFEMCPELRADLRRVMRKYEKKLTPSPS